MSFGPRAEALRRRMLGGLPVTLWLWKTLPLAAFAGLRVIRLNGAVCSVRLPGGWRTQNPFRSTYFGAQAMAAEMSAGAPALALVTDAPASVAMLVIGLQASFSKKIVGPSVFTFEGVEDMGAAVARAADSGEAEVFVARSVGRDGAGDVCAEFEITWSFKRRAR